MLLFTWVSCKKDETAILNRNKVGLDIPSELLGSSASITLKLSSFLGQLIEVHVCNNIQLI